MRKVSLVLLEKYLRENFYWLIIYCFCYLDENPIPSKRRRIDCDCSTENVLSISSDLVESTSSSTPEVDASKFENQSAIEDCSSRIVHHLWLVAERVEKAIAEKASLREFGDSILMYTNLFLENMEISVSNASKKSQQDVDRVISIAENHWLVQPNRLERWIQFKEAELMMFEWMAQVEGVTFLEDENHLKEELAGLQNQSAIVLSIPSLDEWSRKIMEELKNVDPFTTASELPKKDTEPWHLNYGTLKPVFDQICQLTKHAKSNTSGQWKLFLSFEDNGGSCGHFTVYQGKNVVKSNLKDLPISLDELKIQPPTFPTSEIVPCEKDEPDVPFKSTEIPPSKTAGDRIQDQEIAITDEKTACQINPPSAADQQLQVDYIIFVGNFLQESKGRNEKKVQPVTTAPKEDDAEKYKEKRERNRIAAYKFRLEFKKKMRNMEDRCKALKDGILSLNILVSDLTDVSDNFRIQLANAYLIALDEDSAPAPPEQVETPPQNTNKDTRSKRDKNNESVRKSRQKSKNENNLLIEHVKKLEAALHSLRELSSDDNIPENIRLQLEKVAGLPVTKDGEQF